MANVTDGSAYNPFEQVSAFQVELEKVFLYQTAQLMEDYPGLRDNSKIRSMRDAYTQNIILQMTSWCATGRIPDSFVNETFEWPDGVWQTFKEKFMPKWFVLRFPIQMKSKTIQTQTNHYFVCPHIHVPDNGPHIQFMVTGTKTAERMNRQGY